MEKATIVRTELVPIHSVTRHPENARQGNVARIEESLRAHGQYAPIVVHEQTGYILKGNNTHRVLQEKIGSPEILATFVSCTEAQARAILAVDNRTSDDASYDDTALLALLEQVDADGNLAAAGYGQADIDDLTALLEESTEPEPEFLNTDDEPDPDRLTAPPPKVAMASGMEPARKLEDLGRDYATRASRALQLIYPLDQFTWAVEKLSKIGEDLGLENNNNADVVLALIARYADEDPPEPPEAA
jgi:hypothetical protein